MSTLRFFPPSLFTLTSGQLRLVLIIAGQRDGFLFQRCTPVVATEVRKGEEGSTSKRDDVLAFMYLDFIINI